ncbi:hypothetical protein ABPG77_003265 [Micractinium sp. CCAP 211/92]
MQTVTLKTPAFSACLQQRARLGRPQQRALVVRASAGKEEPSLHEKLAGPAAALLGAALLFAATPDEALAARSGGRVGGSSGFSSRAATRAAAPSTTAPTVQNNYYSAPPVFGGFGMPFFGGGFGFGFYPVFGVGLGTIFNILLLGIIIQVVISVVSGFTNQKKKNQLDDEDW